MKFSEKVWSDHGMTWLHFWSIPRNRAMPRCATRGRGLLCFRTTACYFSYNLYVWPLAILYRRLNPGHKPCDFEYPQESHGSENTDAERGIRVVHRPDDFKQTTADDLQRQWYMRCVSWWSADSTYYRTLNVHIRHTSNIQHPCNVFRWKWRFFGGGGEKGADKLLNDRWKQTRDQWRS